MAALWLLETMEKTTKSREAQTTELYPRCAKEESERLSVKKKELEKLPDEVSASCNLGSVFKVNHDEQVRFVNLKSSSTTLKFEMDLRAEVTDL